VPSPACSTYSGSRKDVIRSRIYLRNPKQGVQGVPKPPDVGQSAILMAFSFLPAEFAPLCTELIKYSCNSRKGIKANLDIAQQPK